MAFNAREHKSKQINAQASQGEKNILQEVPNSFANSFCLGLCLHKCSEMEQYTSRKIEKAETNLQNSHLDCCYSKRGPNTAVEGG